AAAAAENVFKADPFFEVESDASPRIAAVFTAARRRVLPGAALEKYRAAKQALEKKDLAAAEAQFMIVKRLLDAAESGEGEEAGKDLRLVVDGFLDLVQAKAEVKTVEAAAAAPPAPVATAPISAPPAPADNATVAPVPPRTPPNTPKRGEIYTAE